MPSRRDNLLVGRSRGSFAVQGGLHWSRKSTTRFCQIILEEFVPPLTAGLRLQLQLRSRRRLHPSKQRRPNPSRPEQTRADPIRHDDNDDDDDDEDDDDEDVLHWKDGLPWKDCRSSQATVLMGCHASRFVLAYGPTGSWRQTSVFSVYGPSAATQTNPNPSPSNPKPSVRLANAEKLTEERSVHSPRRKRPSPSKRSPAVKAVPRNKQTVDEIEEDHTVKKTTLRAASSNPNSILLLASYEICVDDHYSFNAVRTRNEIDEFADTTLDKRHDCISPAVL
ncbi:Uu.00g113140.m01.CDS01 [Anthostomella pinea]|uniref:Uu.00g113140.m01.CDS01 n=1 Tax=Anthostomella pinea TaxID=933095 RepID=A0AAI8VFF4_9PEZI|nr:Uu.00g113140.m01.CDS01 [Anthostomella pinea]